MPDLLNPENYSPLGLGLFVIGVVAAGYALSCWLHPYAACPKCKGAGKHRGSIWTASFRPCHVCNGSGRRRRLGSILLGVGDRGSRGSVFAPPTSPKKRRR